MSITTTCCTLVSRQPFFRLGLADGVRWCGDGFLRLAPPLGGR
eukprot:CAMPEP_0179348894 /NCGR_PEP_ID=MMETSP0797-20121207/73953_1 /TAXON_ID=47934 /ORGANISM="Dinophysis acuminata, Strain DAEP01" /LENGTH=42 /DNA_ID= /DNA_START= /DNA_END= /DNA_ORIENTATION=